MQHHMHVPLWLTRIMAAAVGNGTVSFEIWSYFLRRVGILLLLCMLWLGPCQRCADCRRRYPRTQICRFSCGHGRSADPPNKHIRGREPSADLKPRVLFAGPTSNGSANVSVLSNLRTDPYLETAVGYVGLRKPVWLCGAIGIVYWIQCNPTLLPDADGPRTWVTITVADVDPDACGRGLSADVKFVDPHTSGPCHVWHIGLRTKINISVQNVFP